MAWESGTVELDGFVMFATKEHMQIKKKSTGKNLLLTGMVQYWIQITEGLIS